MASNNTSRARPMIAMLVLMNLLSSGTQALDSGKAPPSPPLSIAPDQDCPWIKVPGLIDACRRPPGLPACVAQCLIHHYHGGYCVMLPNGRPGDCFCINCLSAGQ